MNIAGIAAASLILLGLTAAHAAQWPEILDPYPAGAQIDKPLAVTIDFSDDMWRSRSGVKAANIESLMEKLSKLGFKQVNWIVCPDRYLTQAAILDASPHDGVRLVAAAAHRNGMEFYGLFKPFDTGCVNAEVPPAVKLPPDIPVIPTLSGRLCEYAPFLAKHPEMRIEHRPVADHSASAVATIKLIKEDDAPTRLDAKHIQLLIGKENGRFERYTGPMTFSNAVEKRNGQPVRVLTLSGLKIAPAYRYLVVRTTFDAKGKGDFINASSRMIELYDDGDVLLPSSSDRGIIDAGALKEMLRHFWLDRTGHWGIPAEYALDPAFGTTPQTTAYWFGVTQDSNSDPVRTLDAPGGGYIADARGKDMYMNALQPMYPQVRAFWLKQVQQLIEDGADGVILRVDNHSTWFTDPYSYGFNPPVVDAYRKKYGVDILTQPFDREKWRVLQGDAYTQFVREARTLTQRNHVKLQLSINQLMGPGIPYWGLNNVPVSIQWQWKRWIEEKLCDAVELKLIPWPWGHYMGRGADFASEVSDLAHSHGIKVWANARIQTWWLTMSKHDNPPDKKLSQADLDKIVERLRWVWRSRALDGMIVYENFDFTYLDPQTGISYISPAFESILSNLRQGAAQGLRAQDLKTFYLDQP